MPTSIRIHDSFRKQAKTLKRKYPLVESEIEKLLIELRNGQRPGNIITGVAYTVYKTRLPNPSARRGKSGGFRVIYYMKLADVVYLIAIYSKTETIDISRAEIRQLIAKLL